MAQIVDVDIFTESHISDDLTCTLIDVWTVNLQFSHTSPVPSFTPRQNFQKMSNPIIDIEIIPQLQKIVDKNMKILSLSTKLEKLKNKTIMIYVPIDIVKLTIQGLIDT